MLHIQKKLSSWNTSSTLIKLHSEDSIFFDIETTGLSATSSCIYLIGCMYKKENTLFTEQFFAETKEDEKDILEAFIRLLDNYQTLITFNGTRFDIPFIRSRCMQHHISENFDNFSHIDIFKEIKNMKNFLKLPNYKQKTIETFLGIEREDQYSGGELIAVYEEYLKSSYPQKLQELLLLHNFEDITGMPDLMPIFTYRSILNGAYQIQGAETTAFITYDGEQKHELLITLNNDSIVPKRISFQYKDFYITMYDDITKIRIEIFEGELKYFYDNYKDYFYLPVEDMAIHKSVAEFVDKAHRQRAKACNCYTRKKGVFLPQNTVIISPAFKMDYKDKITYFELTEEFISAKELVRIYVEDIFRNILPAAIQNY